MNKKKGIIAAAAAIIIVAGGYSAFNYYTGNHVQIEQVIAADSQVSANSAEIKSDQLNGSWTIAQPSNVYFSITTSKETVNYSMNDVQGSWLVDLSNPTQMTGEGTVDLNTMSSGNNMRDNHVKGDDYLQVATHSKATFKVKSFDSLASSWKEGEVVPFKMTGILTIKGISKDITFDSKAVYDQGALKLSGTAKTTFADYGMKNPHTVVMETQNDINIQLELSLKKN